jgi:hypothetical protein
MTDVVAHLRQCQIRFAERAARPVVAWDCLGASKWAEVCGRIANEIEGLGLTGEQAVGFLKGKAHAARTRADAADLAGLGILVSLDTWGKFDEIIDPIARDRRGWIEVKGHAEHFGREGIHGMPTYRRMVGVNQCVATLSREWKEERRHRDAPIDAPRRMWIEPEDKWEARRQAWLSRYHDGVLVIHADGGWERDADHDIDADHRPGADMHADIPRARQYTPIYGTVAEHLAEPMPFAMTSAFGMVCRLPTPAQDNTTIAKEIAA